MKWKRPLFLAHRWAGIVLSAFFVLWFVSGFFMMYVEFPQLTRPERLTALPALDFSKATLTPARAIAHLRAGDFAVVGKPARNFVNVIADPSAPVADLAGVRLTMLLGRPVYVVQAKGPAQPRAVYADSGEVLGAIDAAMATTIAQAFATRFLRGQAMSPRYAELLQTDQWTVSSAMNAHRPLHRIALGDADGTELYVSSVTGEVVRDSRRTERLLNYPAAVTHWLYPTVIRRYPDAWAWMVDILSGAGAALAVTGIWIGLLRWKRRPKPGKSAIPYRGLMRWHHITGLAFGLFALTWVFSGLLSMNPAKLDPSRAPSPAQEKVYSGKPLTMSDFALPSFAGIDAIDAELVHYDRRPYYFATLRDGSPRLLLADTGTPGPLPSAEVMQSRAPALMPDAHVLSSETLFAYDDYYYARRPENGSRPLPMVRVKFDDAEHTWFYLDPASGRIFERSTRVNRLYRWLYNGLHSFDILWLWQRRPLWDIVVIGILLGGLALSLIGLIASVRRLRIDLGLS